jgi:hypothetical protein
MKRTTLIWDCWDQLYQALAAAPFTAHPTTGFPVTVAFGGTQDVDLEMVVLPGRSQNDHAAQSWVTSGRPSKDERFTLDVLIWTSVPGRTAIEARDRIKELCSVVEQTLRDPVTGLPQGITLTPADGLEQWQVDDVIPAVGPLDTEGFGASCRIAVSFWARL